MVQYDRLFAMPNNHTSEVTKIATSSLPTEYGEFKISIYHSKDDDKEHVALVKGDLKEPVLTRVHSQCLTGDTFLSLKCDCHWQLQRSLELINQAGSGVLLYLDQEGRGIGLGNKIKTYALQDTGRDTIEANEDLGFPIDNRNYKVAVDILNDLNVKDIILLTNNPDKKNQIEALGINVVECRSIESPKNDENKKYLAIKKDKLGHWLE